jgi:small basic protein (TIGR04137 family)
MFLEAAEFGGFPAQIRWNFARHTLYCPVRSPHRDRNRTEFADMSLDRSLRSKSTLARHRNVLSRAERIARLTDQERWTRDDGVLGLPKVRNLKPKAGGKKKSKTEAAKEGEEAPA